MIQCQSGSAEITLLCCSQAFSSHGKGRGEEGGSHDCVSSQLLPGWGGSSSSSSSICVQNFSGLSSLTAKKGEKKAATSKDLSDMDYLKSKVVKDYSSSSSTEEETDSEEVEEESENEEDLGIAETAGTHTDERGKPKAQQREQETPAKKKKKGSALEV